MASGWAGDNAVNDQIQASIEDEAARRIFDQEPENSQPGLGSQGFKDYRGCLGFH